LSPYSRGLTVSEVAQRYRVSRAKVRAWLRAGKLAGIDTGENGKSRFVILPHHLAEFERQRAAAPPPKPPRRRKRTDFVDFYPD
jgi:excisionase family DNA binding protein